MARRARTGERRRTAAVCLPHDWLTWKLAATGDLTALTTDRGDASGTGYWSPATGHYRHDLLELGFRAQPMLPLVLDPSERAGNHGDVVLGPGTGDNAAAALGVGAGLGDVIVSIGTSGTVFGVSYTPSADPSGIVAGFADATGHFLPLVCTLNAARVLDATAAALGVDLNAFADLALQAPPGADGLVVVPYLEGERTPNRPHATGAIHGWRLANSTPAHVARAACRGHALRPRRRSRRARRRRLPGAADPAHRRRRAVSRRPGHRALGARIPVVVPAAGEYVADGAARQAAWVLRGGDEPPVWATPEGAETFEADPQPSVRARYAEVRDLTATR